VPVRVVLVVLAAVLVVALSLRLGDHDVCGDARRAVFGATTGQTPAAEVARHVRTVEAARREPESFSAWRALAAVGDREEAERARRRALELNPRWAPPR
jgi:hypothetical protein